MKINLLMGVAALAAFAAPQAYAQTATAPVTPEAADEAIVVIGQGQVRQGQTLDAEVLATLPAGTSPIRLVQRLPGVAVSGADTFGAYEWAARINIRGFSQNQLGFTLDGVPLGDMSYANHNGLHISRAIISENLGSVSLTQGSGAINVASSSNLAGALQFSSVEASEDFGVNVGLTYGSDETTRAFARLNTGTFGPLDTRGWISYVDSAMDKWKGEGEQNQQQWAVRLEQPVGDGLITVYYNNSSRQENDYHDLSLGQIARLGNDWDNFGQGQYGLAVRVADIAHNRGDTGQPVTNAGAGTVYPAPIQTADDAYFDASGLRDDQLVYAAIDYPISDTFEVRFQVYNHRNIGQGLWGTPYRVSPNATVAGATTDNSPLSIRTTEYNIDRTGVLGSATWEIGSHTINGGFWYESNYFNQYRRFYALNRAAPNRDFLEMQGGTFFTQWAYAFDTDTTQFYLQDTWDVTDRLTVNFGFKSLEVQNTVATLEINNAAPVLGSDSNLNGRIETDEDFLPQAGFTFAVTDDIEVFGSYAENTAAFPSVVGSVFGSRSQAVFVETRNTVRPESSTTYEGGLRWSAPQFQFSAAAYYVQFEDRLLSVSQGPGIVGNAPIVSNVGGVETVGLELLGVYNVTDTITAFASYTYNNSEYEDDVRNRAGVVQAATGGKRVVNTPEHLFFGELAYDDGRFFGGVSTNYIGDRYFTFTNNGGLVDGRWLADLNVGYRFAEDSLLNGLEAQLNVSNLTDEEYVGTLGTNGFVNAGDSQTLVTGAPRQVFLTLRYAY